MDVDICRSINFNKVKQTDLILPTNNNYCSLLPITHSHILCSQRNKSVSFLYEEICNSRFVNSFAEIWHRYQCILAHRSLVFNLVIFVKNNSPQDSAGMVVVGKEYCPE